MDNDTFNRRLAIREKLIESGRKISATEFAEEFNVSRNTIVHDRSLLSLNCNITSSVGRGGGYRYAGDDRKLSLNREEAERVLRNYDFEQDDIIGKTLYKRLFEFIDSFK